MTEATKTLFAVAVAGALTACAPSSPPLGPTDAPPAEIGQLFAAVCYQTLPDFADAPRVLATLPFTEEEGTSTFFHDVYDLSFQVNGPQTQGECSLAVNLPTGADLTSVGPNMIAAGIQNFDSLTLGQRDVGAGRTFYNFRIPAE